MFIPNWPTAIVIIVLIFGAVSILNTAIRALQHLNKE